MMMVLDVRVVVVMVHNVMVMVVMDLAHSAAFAVDTVYRFRELPIARVSRLSRSTLPMSCRGMVFVALGTSGE